MEEYELFDGYGNFVGDRNSSMRCGDRKMKRCVYNKHMFAFCSSLFTLVVGFVLYLMIFVNNYQWQIRQEECMEMYSVLSNCTIFPAQHVPPGWIEESASGHGQDSRLRGHWEVNVTWSPQQQFIGKQFKIYPDCRYLIKDSYEGLESQLPTITDRDIKCYVPIDGQDYIGVFYDRMMPSSKLEYLSWLNMGMIFTGALFTISFFYLGFKAWTGGYAKPLVRFELEEDTRCFSTVYKSDTLRKGVLRKWPGLNPRIWYVSCDIFLCFKHCLPIYFIWKGFLNALWLIFIMGVVVLAVQTWAKNAIYI